MQFSNGGEGKLSVEPGWFQIWPAQEVLELNRVYKVDVWLPGFFGFGSGGELLAIHSDSGKIHMIPFIMAQEEVRLIANRFAEFVAAMGHDEHIAAEKTHHPRRGVELENHTMPTTVEGVWRNGQVELSNLPVNVGEETQVIVTFLSPQGVDLGAMGINPEQAAELRASLATFAPDWNAPEMDVYDDYDAAKSNIQSAH